MFLFYNTDIWKKKALILICMVFTFNQISVTNPLQLESTNFSFMLVTPLNLQLGTTSKVTSATACSEQPTANGTEQIQISEKVKLQHQIVPRVCN